MEIYKFVFKMLVNIGREDTVCAGVIGTSKLHISLIMVTGSLEAATFSHPHCLFIKAFF